MALAVVLTQAGGGNGGNTSDDSSGGSSSGGSDTGSSSGSGSESGNTGGSSSGSSEQVPEGFVKIPAALIAGTENWMPEASLVFVSGRKMEIASFYMSDHEVTRGEYKAVIGSDPSTASARDKNENNPVNYVSWYDALVYCNTRSIKENLTPCYKINGSTDPSD